MNYRGETFEPWGHIFGGGKGILEPWVCFMGNYGTLAGHIRGEFRTLPLNVFILSPLLPLLTPPSPSLSVTQAAEFRVFWGEKAELRRFQDGSINEAVVWGGGSVGGRRGVVTQVVRHLLQR